MARIGTGWRDGHRRRRDIRALNGDGVILYFAVHQRAEGACIYRCGTGSKPIVYHICGPSGGGGNAEAGISCCSGCGHGVDARPGQCDGAIIGAGSDRGGRRFFRVKHSVVIEVDPADQRGC